MTASSVTPPKKRLFLAVNLSVAVTRKVAEAVDRMRGAARAAPGLEVAWVPPANLHVTLKFLGWTNAEAVLAVRDQLRAGLAGRKGFEIGARGVGAFPSEQAARVLWVGVTDPTGGLARLAADVEAWMEGIGFPREARPFSAHLTVGRVKQGGAAAEAVLAPLAQTDFGSALVRAVVLYESVTKSTGSEYAAVERVALDVAPYRAERQTREVEEESTEPEEPDTHGGQSA